MVEPSWEGITAEAFKNRSKYLELRHDFENKVIDDLKTNKGQAKIQMTGVFSLDSPDMKEVAEYVLKKTKEQGFFSRVIRIEESHSHGGKYLSTYFQVSLKPFPELMVVYSKERWGAPENISPDVLME